MIPIKDAISNGGWLHCEFNNSKELLRIKILSFQKLNLLEVDNPERINLKDDGTIIWIMDLEVVNLSKVPISPTYGPHKIILIDQEGFQFNFFDDDHLSCYSKFALNSKLKRLYAQDLIPKIKAVGAISFQLPDDDEAVYSISIKEGSIREA